MHHSLGTAIRDRRLWAGFVVVGAIVIAAIIVVVVVSPNGVSNEKKPQVTPQTYKEITVGMSQDAVERLVGPPESSNRAMVNGRLETCLYYEVLAESGTYQFCFADSTLDSKAKY
jgi:hypothetical protein